MSPMFGLESVESLETEEMKKRYVELKAKKSLKSIERNELKKITKMLNELPDRNFESEIEKKQLELLRVIESKL